MQFLLGQLLFLILPGLVQGDTPNTPESTYRGYGKYPLICGPEEILVQSPNGDYCTKRINCQPGEVWEPTSDDSGYCKPKCPPGKTWVPSNKGGFCVTKRSCKPGEVPVSGPDGTTCIPGNSPKQCPDGEIWVASSNGGACEPKSDYGSRPECPAKEYQNLVGAKYDYDDQVFYLVNGKNVYSSQLPRPNRIYCDDDFTSYDYNPKRLSIKLRDEFGCKIVCQVCCS